VKEMGTQERRERQKQVTRASILDAARQIAASEGWSAVTIRRIADQIEYTSPIIYQYFNSKEDALVAVVMEGYQALEAAMSIPLETRDTDEMVLVLTRAYLNFVQAQPRVYELMHGMGGVTIDPLIRANAASSMCQLTLEVLQSWAEEKGIVLLDVQKTVEIISGVLHGMACMGMLPNIGFERAEQLAVEAVQDLLWSWQSNLET
jgi:AcrR family transcriptional regulator